MMTPKNAGYAEFLSSLDEDYCLTALGDLFYLKPTPSRIGYISLCMHAGQEQYRVYLQRGSAWRSVAVKPLFKEALLALWSVGTLMNKEEYFV